MPKKRGRGANLKACGQRLLQSDDAWLVGSLEMGTVMLLGHVSRKSFVRLAALSVASTMDESARARAQYVQVTMQLFTCWSLRAWQAGAQECRTKPPPVVVIAAAAHLYFVCDVLLLLNVGCDRYQLQGIHGQ